MFCVLMQMAFFVFRCNVCFVCFFLFVFSHVYHELQHDRREWMTAKATRPTVLPCGVVHETNNGDGICAGVLHSGEVI